MRGGGEDEEEKEEEEEEEEEEQEEPSQEPAPAMQRSILRRRGWQLLLPGTSTQRTKTRPIVTTERSLPIRPVFNENPQATRLSIGF